MESEYGPPIPVNGKRPDWLEPSATFMRRLRGGDGFLECPWRVMYADWHSIDAIRLPASHTYYQSAEYKASVGWDDLETRGAIAKLEAKGYTVTPPDPLAADREFLAGFNEASGFNGAATRIRHHAYDAMIPAAMEYLRANKERL